MQIKRALKITTSIGWYIKRCLGVAIAISPALTSATPSSSYSIPISSLTSILYFSPLSRPYYIPALPLALLITPSSSSRPRLQSLPGQLVNLLPFAGAEALSTAKCFVQVRSCSLGSHLCSSCCLYVGVLEPFLGLVMLRARFCLDLCPLG
jgi:hypothetical protein